VFIRKAIHRKSCLTPKPPQRHVAISDDHMTAIIEPLRGIINLLRERNPEIVVLLGQIHYTSSGHRAMHTLVDALAEEINTEGSPVRTVPLYQGFKPYPKHASTDTFDWAHPNPAGQRKIAEHFLKAMRPFLPAD
jgi:lysophospholipase L1-like esterase